MIRVARLLGCWSIAVVWAALGIGLTMSDLHALPRGSGDRVISLAGLVAADMLIVWLVGFLLWLGAMSDD